MEHRVGEDGVGAQESLGQHVGRLGVQGLDVATGAEGRPDGGDPGPGGRLVAGDGDVVGVDEAQVHPALTRTGDHVGRRARHPDGERVEVSVVHDLGPGGTQALGQDGGEPVGAPGDRPQPLGPVVDGVHTGHDGEQHLGRADVAGGLLPADVLLPGLQCQPVGLVAVRVDGDTDEAAGQAAGELLAHGHEAGVRSAEAHRDAEALRGAHGDVRAQLAGRGEQRQGQQVGGDGHDRAQPVRLLDDGPEVAYGAGGARVLEQHAEDAAFGDLRRDAVGEVGDDDLDTGRLGAGLDHGDGLRQGVGVDQEDAALHLSDPPCQSHGLGRGRALVEQRGTRGRQPGEVGDHRLEVQQGLETSLGDLRLVRRVGRVPGGVLHDVAQDDRRGERPVVAEPDHRCEDLVAVGKTAQLGQDLGLGAGLGEVQRLGTPDHVGHGGGGELVEGAVADLGEHLRLSPGIGPDVAVLERNALLQLGERSATGGHDGGLLVCHDLRGAPRRGCPDGLPLCHLT